MHKVGGLGAWSLRKIVHFKPSEAVSGINFNALDKNSCLKVSSRMIKLVMGLGSDALKLLELAATVWM